MAKSATANVPASGTGAWTSFWSTRKILACVNVLIFAMGPFTSAAVITNLGKSGRGGESRTNSRFLRTFPPYNYYQNFRRADTFNEIPNYPLVNGNSPVFYIRLPPAPYVLVPGLGYVSPHPYNSPMSNGIASSVLMNGISPGVMDLSSEGSLQQNVISLPLKFLSNGRPAQIESVKKPSKIQASKGSELIPGGKYSFNGRPTAVFVVRSPA